MSMTLHAVFRPEGHGSVAQYPPYVAEQFDHHKPQHSDQTVNATDPDQW